MGLFDLDDYKAKKARADESAKPPREFPVALADAFFDGRRQTLRFQPILFDGGHVFIGFASQNAAPGQDLVAGGGDQPSISLLGADEFAFHLERERADPNSVYGISSRWDEMSFQEKSAMLPPIETLIGEELVPLLRAAVWSAPSPPSSIRFAIECATNKTKTPLDNQAAFGVSILSVVVLGVAQNAQNRFW